MKTNQPLFSVLIANYNNGKYLMEAIESVRQQTYANWEIVLVDDASTDNSKELYKELEKDERIHIYLNEQNMGCGYTKRRCAELATGEICGFLDPDDVLVNEALEVMVDAHKNHPEASIVNSTYYVTDEQLNIIRQSPNECQIPEGSSFLEYGHGVGHFTTYKNSSYKQTGGISADLYRAVDHDLYFRLEEVGKVVYVDKPLYLYRQGTGNNISLGNNSRKALYWDCIVRIDACRRRGLSAEELVFPYLEEATKELLEEEVLRHEKAVRATKAYRLGRFLLEPIRRMREIIG